MARDDVVSTDVVSTRGLSKHYRNGVVAVSDLDLRIEPGEVYGFLGPNGAGKTTTLRMLVGLVRPSAGQVTVLGHAPGSPIGMRSTGSLIEAPALYPHLTGRDNLRLLARYSGIGDRRADELLDEVGLADRGHDRFGTYSLGMKQRLGVAAALLKDPSLLILDEPTNGLDPAGVVAMRQLIRALGQGNRTVVLSSHLLGEVEQTCDRVGVIRQGRLVTEGSVAEMRAAAPGHGLLLLAEPADRAVAVLEALPGVHGVAREVEMIRVRVDPVRAAEINRELVLAGVAVAELRPARQSLEDVFLELTGGEPAEPDDERSGSTS